MFLLNCGWGLDLPSRKQQRLVMEKIKLSKLVLELRIILFDVKHKLSQDDYGAFYNRLSDILSLNEQSRKICNEFLNNGHCHHGNK